MALVADAAAESAAQIGVEALDPIACGPLSTTRANPVYPASMATQAA
jgi:hypothetical protein